MEIHYYINEILNAMVLHLVKLSWYAMKNFNVNFKTKNLKNYYLKK